RCYHATQNDGRLGKPASLNQRCCVSRSVVDIIRLNLCSLAIVTERASGIISAKRGSQPSIEHCVLWILFQKLLESFAGSDRVFAVCCFDLFRGADYFDRSI